MMKVLFDLNILIDVLARREPWFDRSARAWGLVETGQIAGIVSADSFTTLYYLTRQYLGHVKALEAVVHVAGIFEIATVTADHVHQAAHPNVVDFEDAVLAYSGISAGATHVLTRNSQDFHSLPIIVVDADELLRMAAEA